LYLFEVLWGDPAALFWIVLGEALIDGSKIGQVFILGECESDFENEAVDLGVELHSEE